MDVRDVLARKQRKVDLVGLAGVTFCVVVLTLGFDGGWTGSHFLIGGLAGMGYFILEAELLRRAVARRARELEQHASAFGLTPSAADSRVHEGTREGDQVRVWIPDDPRKLRQTVHGIAFTAVVSGLWFWAGAWLGAAGLTVALVLAALWTTWTTRLTIEIEGVQHTGLRHRTRVHNFADVEAALAALRTLPPLPERFPLPPGADIQQLLSRVRSMENDDAALDALIKLGETGVPTTLEPLMHALRQRERGPIPPRMAAVAERAVERIRERHGLAERGALGLSEADDGAGRMAVVKESGALSTSGDK
jgi:hypothetical protein